MDKTFDWLGALHQGFRAAARWTMSMLVEFGMLGLLTIGAWMLFTLIQVFLNDMLEWGRGGIELAANGLMAATLLLLFVLAFDSIADALGWFVKRRERRTGRQTGEAD